MNFNGFLKFTDVKWEWLRRIIRPLLIRIPWLRRKVQLFLWRMRARPFYRQRIQGISKLLDDCNARRRKNGGPKNIILIVVDCLRKSNLSLYGHYRETTPFLESLAGRAAVFDNTLTACPWTYPSVASILTGLYPHNHGGVLTTDPCRFGQEAPNKVSRNVLALPEVLTGLGFDCHIFSSVTVAAWAGMDWFKNIYIYRQRAQQQFKELNRCLEKNKKKDNFIYFHLGDLHVPLDVPDDYRESFGEIADIPRLNYWQFEKDADREAPDFKRYKENRCKLYDCALRSVDAQIAGLFGYLEKLRLLDSSLVILTADHGEEFWEHTETERKLFYDPRGFSGISHGHNLFQEIINVPLLCTGPGIASGRYTHNTSLVDIVPTILDVCGIDHRLKLDGRNLFDNSNERALVSEAVAYGYEKKAVVRKNWKLIHSEGDGVSLLFDLYRDPKEKHDLAKINPEKIQELKSHLPKAEVKGETLEIDRAMKKQLQDLGYM
ncbi:MAG TPA: sulfatase [Planctomycetes bacterium]|nr:sulfatase [Planctomycetota bacterium]